MPVKSNLKQNPMSKTHYLPDDVGTSATATARDAAAAAVSASSQTLKKKPTKKTAPRLNSSGTSAATKPLKSRAKVNLASNQSPAKAVLKTKGCTVPEEHSSTSQTAATETASPVTAAKPSLSISNTALKSAPQLSPQEKALKNKENSAKKMRRKTTGTLGQATKLTTPVLDREDPPGVITGARLIEPGAIASVEIDKRRNSEAPGMVAIAGRSALEMTKNHPRRSSLIDRRANQPRHSWPMRHHPNILHSTMPSVANGVNRDALALSPGTSSRRKVRQEYQKRQSQGDNHIANSRSRAPEHIRDSYKLRKHRVTTNSTPVTRNITVAPMGDVPVPPPPPYPPTSGCHEPPLSREGTSGQVQSMSRHSRTPSSPQDQDNRNFSHQTVQDYTVSAALVVDEVEDDSAVRDSIYRQAHEDAVRSMLDNVCDAEEVVDETAIKQRQRRRWLVWATCAVTIVATLTGVSVARPWKEESFSGSTLDNDLCTGAISMSLGDVEMGTTVGASPVNFDTCASSVQTGGNGVWYQIIGTGAPMKVSTCNSNISESFDTQITLFQGSCGDLSCVGGNDNGPDDECGVLSSVAWPSEFGETYILCVHGRVIATSDVDGDVRRISNNGTFELTAEETTPNDFCEGSLPVEVNGPNIKGSTSAATSDKQVPFCHGTDSTAPGVWYVVQGTGTPLQVAIINPDMNTQLTVYEGSAKVINRRKDCSSMRCIAGYDNPFDFMSKVTFSSMNSTFYYVLVHGVDRLRGDFEISARQTAENDVCETAISIDNSSLAASIAGENGGKVQVIEGSTIDATADARSVNADFCQDIAPLGVGVWFTVEGNGGISEAFTSCDDEAEASTNGQLSETTLMVFQGDGCRNLKCIASSIVCGQDNPVMWEAARRVKYYILVSGKVDSKGSFRLQVQSTPS